MGVKTRVLPGFLDRILAEEAPPGSTVVDLMSGSATVAAHCANGRRVYSNDVQLYAQVIAASLIEHDPSTKASFLESLDLQQDLGSAYRLNLAALEHLYAPALEAEQRLLQRFAAGEEDPAWRADYRRFLADPDALYGSSMRQQRTETSGLYDGAQLLLSEESIRSYRAEPSRGPFCLTTVYYANVYFGLRQSIVIDSLRAAIEALPASDRYHASKRTHYLSALIHAASISTSGTSHFAQPRHFTKDSELRALAVRRSLDVFERFTSWSVEIARGARGIDHQSGNQAFSLPYRQFIAQGAEGPELRFPGPIDLVYLDPPYTADHYSRFYHVLEVLARYDYPELELDLRGDVLRGRYPKGDARFQSGFCHKTQVEEEFRTIVHASAGARAKLVVSYASPSGLLLKQYARRQPTQDPVELLCELCKTRYETVRVERLPLLHSGQGDRNLEIEEILVICTNPRPLR